MPQNKQDEQAQITFKAAIHQQKFILTVWRNYKRAHIFEIGSHKQMFNEDVYIEQLTQLSNVIQEKRSTLANQRAIVFHYENTRTHTSLGTWKNLLKLVCDVFPYSF